ncbi:MAG: sel1 repeat family protein [archaeon]|nr:sel1 repeat family protein [archaeon]
MNRRKSFELFSKAADLGDFHGMRICANLMMKGVDAPLDIVKARELYMKDAEESDLASLEALMEMDLGDVGKPANPKDAYSVAVNCILKRDFAKAEKKLRPGAKRGDEAHMNLLALMHLKGWIKTDRTEMTDLFRRALDKGNYMAGYYLGSILSEEECDRETVFDCFMRGLDAGDERAMWRLGRMMYEGDGTTMNREEGIRWMRSAREFGVAEAGEYLAKEGIE